jgi:surfactin synthase thioesterase subunit
VGGWRAPHLQSPFRGLGDIAESDLDREESRAAIVEHLRALEVPESVLVNRATIDALLPALKAEIIMAKRYAYREDAPLPCPVTALLGERDTIFTEDQLREWERHTTAAFRFRRVPGAHLFIRDDREEALAVLRELLGPNGETGAARPASGARSGGDGARAG